MRRPAIALGLGVALLAIAPSARAQVRSRAEASMPRNPGVARRQQLPNEGTGGANRAQLERRFQQMLFQVTRQRVGLTDEQMKRLVPVNQRFTTQRRAIQRQERQTRVALRDAIRDSSQADQVKITEYLDRLLDLQRQRVELLAQEQKDLAEFMTPLQRAKYTALQEQVRQRIDQMRRQRRASTDTTFALPPRP
jgi:Spy/CpxP family protein refolding chaperone